MELESHGPDTFVGVGPEYPWGGLYGGQIVAQALMAAGRTVDEVYLPHSLHAYFIRPGDASQPIRFEVDRLRNGRSFVTRQVVARQAGGAILTMIGSFQVEEDAADVQAATMPEVPPPGDAGSDAWTEMFDRRSLTRQEEPERERAWMSLSEPLDTDDPLLHACGLAYMSDDLPTEPVRVLHPAWTPERHDEPRFMSVSLDHAMWFHRPFRADEWLLYSQDTPSTSGARGLARGLLFTHDGQLAVSVVQEGLIRVIDR